MTITIHEVTALPVGVQLIYDEASAARKKYPFLIQASGI